MGTAACRGAGLRPGSGLQLALTGTSIQYPSLVQRWMGFEAGFSAVILAVLAVILAV